MNSKTLNIHIASTRTGMSDVSVASSKTEYEIKRFKDNRNYFEIGCLCLKNGSLKPADKSLPDIKAVEYYENNCTCSRNYKHLERN